MQVMDKKYIKLYFSIVYTVYKTPRSVYTRVASLKRSPAAIADNCDTKVNKKKGRIRNVVYRVDQFEVEWRDSLN